MPLPGQRLLPLGSAPLGTEKTCRTKSTGTRGVHPPKGRTRLSVSQAPAAKGVLDSVATEYPARSADLKQPFYPRKAEYLLTERWHTIRVLLTRDSNDQLAFSFHAN